MIIMDYGSRTTPTEALTIVEQCNRALCQHDATDLVSMLVDSNKSDKVPVAVVKLAEAEVDKTLYWCSCGQATNAKKDCLSKQTQAQTVGIPK